MHPEQKFVSSHKTCRTCEILGNSSSEMEACIRAAGICSSIAEAEVSQLLQAAAITCATPQGRSHTGAEGTNQGLVEEPFFSHAPVMPTGREAGEVRDSAGCAS